MRRALAVSIVLGLASPVRAQPAVALARAVAHESSVAATEDEAAAIFAAVTNRPGCRGLGPMAALRCAMPRSHRGLTPRSRYMQLRRGGPVAPWPAFDPWTPATQLRWHSLVRICRRVVRGEIVHRCSQVPTDWIARGYRLRRGFVPVDCGDTANAYACREHACEEV